MNKPHQFLMAVLFFQFTLFTVQAQFNSVDSLENHLKTNLTDKARVLTYTELGREYIYVSPNKALEYALKANELATKINFLRGKAHALRTLASVNRVFNNYFISNNFLTEAIKIFEELGDKHGLGNCYISFGNTYNQQNIFDKANEYNFKAIDIFRELGMKERLGKCFNNTGESFLGLKDYYKAFSYMDSSLAINKELGIKQVMMSNYKNFGLIYHALGQKKKSIENFQEVINLSKHLGSKANTNAECIALLALANEYQQRDEKKSVNYLKKTIELADKFKYYQYSSEAYSVLYQIYSSRKEIAKADSFLLLYVIAKDFMLSNSNYQRTKALEAIYSAKDKEAEILNLNHQKELQETVIEKQQILLGVAIILVAITLVISVFLVKNSQRRKRNNQFLETQGQRLQRSMAKLEIARYEAIQANKAKTQFLANMSHEIRSPLNAIVGFSQILMNMSIDQKLPVTFKEFIAHIITAGENLSELINNILDLSKIESGKMEILVESINFKQLFEGVYHINKEQAAKKNVGFVYKYDEELPIHIDSDRTKLNQILMNLVSNAIKFTPSGKKIVMDATEEKGYIFIKVTDEGIGIAQDRIQNIFESFEQADNTITRRFGGTGLGLSITKNMVEILGGSISVESTEGFGSEFTVRIPLISSDHQKPMERELKLSDYKFSPDNIVLAVEDLELNRQMLKSLFDQLDLKLNFAKNGLEGIAKVKELKPDLVLMDIHMPGMDGIEATIKIKEMQDFEELPVVGISADAFIDQQKKALKAGLNEYITKPVDFNKLLPILAKYLTLEHVG